MIQVTTRICSGEFRLWDNKQCSCLCKVCTCYNFIFPSTASAFICQNKVNKTKYDPSTETCCNGTVASKLNHSDNLSSIECCEGTVLYQVHENNNERLITKKNINGQLKVYNLNVIFYNF